MKYTLIREADTSIPVIKAVELLGVSRSGYYRWRKLDGDNEDNMELRNLIQNIAIEFPAYGYRRITVELRNRGYRVNHKKVLRLMREDNLLCVKKIFKPITTDSNHNYRKYPNLVKDLEVNRINQVWAADITYIRLLKEYIYLAVIIDVFSRRCVGWELGRNLDAQLTLSALKKALRNRKPMIHHSDQGVQYASSEYVSCLEEHSIRISMSRKGNPYDNAFVESFIGTLKTEEVHLNEYETFSDAMSNIGEFIEEVYNRKRLHSSLGYKSPEDFEMEVGLNTDA